jgi:hypothetical protein
MLAASTGAKMPHLKAIASMVPAAAAAAATNGIFSVRTGTRVRRERRRSG